jgi:hypothetical protein
MTDPFWMMMVMRNLDRSYTVWDKSAEIDFLRPGRGTVSASFRLTEEDLDDIRAIQCPRAMSISGRFRWTLSMQREIR